LSVTPVLDGYNLRGKISHGEAKKFGGIQNLQKSKFLPIEIPENRQRNIWKSLTKSLENLTKICKKFAARVSARGCPSTPPAQRASDIRPHFFLRAISAVAQ
jgi:hypothetical protein